MTRNKWVAVMRPCIDYTVCAYGLAMSVNMFTHHV